MRVRGGEREGVRHQRHQGGAMRPRRDQGMHQDFLSLNMGAQPVLYIFHAISDYIQGILDSVTTSRQGPNNHKIQQVTESDKVTV